MTGAVEAKKRCVYALEYDSAYYRSSSAKIQIIVVAQRSRKASSLHALGLQALRRGKFIEIKDDERSSLPRLLATIMTTLIGIDVEAFYKEIVPASVGTL